MRMRNRAIVLAVAVLGASSGLSAQAKSGADAMQTALEFYQKLLEPRADSTVLVVPTALGEVVAARATGVLGIGLSSEPGYVRCAESNECAGVPQGVRIVTMLPMVQGADSAVFIGRVLSYAPSEARARFGATQYRIRLRLRAGVWEVVEATGAAG